VPRRKDRLPVVFDTNVIVGYLLRRRLKSATSRIFDFWYKQHQLQLIVSDEAIAEYYELLEYFGVDTPRAKQLRDLLQRTTIVTHVNLGARHAISRDPDDDVFLATAAAGQAQFLITNDHDLLDIPAAQKKRFRFEIVTPGAFLARWETLVAKK
jgi:putative PIN family toxin of toxin-antitoxin system